MTEKQKSGKEVEMQFTLDFMEEDNRTIVKLAQIIPENIKKTEYVKGLSLQTIFNDKDKHCKKMEHDILKNKDIEDSEIYEKTVLSYWENCKN